MTISDTTEAIRILRSVNFIDSGLFGLTVDVFKLRLLLSTHPTPQMERFGYNPAIHVLGFDFRSVENLKFDFHLAGLGPAYLEDGDLAAIDIAQFRFEPLELRKAGATHQTDKLGVLRDRGDMVDVYEVSMPLNYGLIEFQFSNLRVATHIAQDLDR
jgi:hypothetical protein